MNLPFPFESAQDVRPDLTGRIALVDGDGKVLAHLPLTTAHGIAPEGWGSGFGDGYGYGRGSGSGRGYGSVYGRGYGSGSGFGDGYGFGFSSGEGRGK